MKLFPLNDLSGAQTFLKSVLISTSTACRLAGLCDDSPKITQINPGMGSYEDYVREFLGDVRYKLVELESWEAVFKTKERFDAVVGLAKSGWTGR
jgi:hypothetical protein